MSITAKITNVTPALAQRLLKFNNMNRSLSENLIARYVADMEAGNWQLNGEPIIVGASGVLTDGQHRLTAVARSGKTIPMLVVRGVDDETFETVNSGDGRTFGQVLGIKGEVSENVLSASVNLMRTYEEGGLSGRGKKHRRPTRSELQSVLDRHAGLRKSVSLCCGKSWHRLLSPSVAAFCHYVFQQEDQDKADKFIAGLRDGTNLSETSPILLLRNRLIEDKEGADRLHKRAKLFLIFKAWGAYTAGRRLKRLQLPKSGDFSLPDLTLVAA